MPGADRFLGLLLQRKLLEAKVAQLPLELELPSLVCNVMLIHDGVLRVADYTAAILPRRFPKRRRAGSTHQSC